MDRKINYISFTTAAAYALVAGLWITLSDRLLGTMVESTEKLTKIQQYKGWGFVLITAVLLYTLLRRQIGEYRKVLIAKHDLDIQHQEMEEKAAGYFEVSPVVGYVLVVRNNKIEPIWVSENIGDVLGISGRVAEQSDFWEEILRKDRLEVEKVQETENTVSRAGYYKREYRLEDDQGNPRWVQDIYRIHPAGEGVPGKMIGVLMDISDRTNEERQKEKFFQAMGNTTDLVFVTDREGVIEYVNPAFEELTGFSAEEAIGKTASILNSGEMEDDFYADFWRKILGGEVAQVEVINQTKTGRRFIYEQTVTPVYDDLGKITHFVSAGRDTTERRELLIQIKARNLELAALNAISAESIRAKSSAEILPLIVKEVKRLLRADAAGVTLLNFDRTQFHFAAADGCWEDKLGETFPVGEGLSSRVLHTGDAYVTENYCQDEFALPEEQAEETGPAMFVPLRSEEQVIGVLAFFRHLTPDVEPYTSSEVNLLSTIGHMVGNTYRRLELFEDAKRRLKQTETLRKIDLAITSNYDLEVILNVALMETVDSLGVDAAAVLGYEPNLHLLEYLAGRGFKTDAVMKTQINYGEGWAGKALQMGEIVSGEVAQENLHNSQRQDVMMQEDFRLYYAAPMMIKGQVRGVLEVFSRKPLSISAEWEGFLTTIAGEIAVAMESSNLFIELERANYELLEAHDETIRGWAYALALRDEETEEHTQRVTELTLRMASEMGVPRDELKHIRRGALLHDIGKMGVPDSILLKPGKLDPEEWEVMQRHPVLAYEMLVKIDHLRPAMDIPRFHHEKWDGSGYPQGLRGEEIPLAARIFAVADVWDALLSDRPYRKAWARERVLEHIQAESGTHFDPRVVEMFLEIIERKPEEN